MRKRNKGLKLKQNRFLKQEMEKDAGGTAKTYLFINYTITPPPLLIYGPTGPFEVFSIFRTSPKSRECTKREPVRAQRLLSFLINFANRPTPVGVCVHLIFF